MELTPKKIAIHLGLFLLTFVTTTLAGAEWTFGKSVLSPDYSWADFLSGMPYSVPFLLILSVHEFGHYFTAIHYKVRTTLPYYIPLPPLPYMFGTLGALIRLKSRVPSKQQNFDIGIAGPLAGFVVALVVLVYGFSTLPPVEYIFQIHPEYEQYGKSYADVVYSTEYLSSGVIDIIIGKNILYLMLEKYVGAADRIPNVHEIMHYPYLFAGFLSLVFTSINLLPIGQLDGGHVLYGLVGFRKHKMIASIVFMVFLFYAGLGTVRHFGPNSDPWWHTAVYVMFLYVSLLGLKKSWQDTLMYAVIIFSCQFLLAWFVPGIQGYPGWLLFAFLIGRFVGIEHPPCEIEEPLSANRKIIGWIALVIFVLCFAPAPITIIPPAP